MSLVPQFAHGRAQLPFTSANLAVSGGGTTTAAYTLYFSLQADNPVGSNLPSALVPITVNAGQQLTVTLPIGLREAGEYWSGYSLSASSFNDASTLVQLARISATDSTGTLIALPQTITLSADQHFQRSAIVANPAALPSSPLPGMRRGVSSLASVFEYDPLSTLSPNDLTVLAATVGNWVQVGAFSNYITDTSQAGGCAQAITAINEQVVKTARYSCNGANGLSRVFWLNNTSSDPITSGQRVMLAVTLNDIPRSATFEGLLRARFHGYVNTSTGELRTTTSTGEAFTGLDNEILFENRKTDLVFQDDLQAGEAYCLEVYPNLIPAYLNYELAQNSIIKLIPSIAAQAGAFAEGGDALGDRIYPKYDRGVCVPLKGRSVKCLKRSGLVNSRSFLAIAPTIVTGFASNTADQQVRINGNGAVYRTTDTLLDSEAIRAKVWCEAGIGTACPLSAAATVDGTQGLAITVAYPSNGTTATIRSDYPDLLLAGNTQGQLNALYVTLYVLAGSTLKKFEHYLIVDGAAQTFTLDDWSAGTTISAIPAATAVDFGLFAALSATVATSGTGNFPAGSVQVAYAFEGDGTTISKISHARTDGCLHTATMDLADIEETVQFWGLPVANFAALPTAGSIIGQVVETLDDGTLYRWTGTAWSPVTSRRYWGDPVANFAALPGSAEPGQVRLALDTGKLYRWTGTVWQLASGASSGGNGVLNTWRLTA